MNRSAHRLHIGKIAKTELPRFSLLFVWLGALGCHEMSASGADGSMSGGGTGANGGTGAGPGATGGAGNSDSGAGDSARGTGGSVASTGGAAASPGSDGGASGGTSGAAGGSSATGGAGDQAASGGRAGGGAGGGGASSGGASSLSATRLRTELREDPLGVQPVTPRLSWELVSTDDKARGQVQAAYELLVASSPALLATDQGDLWSSGVVSAAESATIYAGKPLTSYARVNWKVRVRDGAGRLSAWSTPATWTEGLLNAADWGAQWITGGGTGALPLFRREFDVAKPVERALISLCGFGQFELRVNGTNPSDAVMEPSWTNFTKTCHYSTYDITPLVVVGANALGVMLGNGMYNVPSTSRYAKFTGSFGPPKMIAHLEITHTDGTKSTVVSDTQWRAAPGPITFSNIYGGEDFDARLEPVGWDRARFATTTTWTPVTVVAGSAPSPTLVARSAPPVKVMQDLPGARFTEPMPGVFVYDLGQNFSGWPEITVRGVGGVIVKMSPGEILGTTGLVNQAAVGSPVWFAFTPKGTTTEIWHPRFTYTGFRYIQVEGAVPSEQAARFPGRPQIVALTGKFLHASAESVGKFSSSDADINKIHALILAAIRSNMQNVVTDCPQREKLGWLETTHLLATSIAFDYDVAALYEKIIRDMRDSQLADGMVPSIAPEYPVFSGGFRDSPEWGSAFVINPWFVYQMYGDRQPLDEHYANMKRYVSYLGGKAAQNIVAYGLGDWYDVGPNPPGVSQLTTLGLTGTATWLQNLAVLRQTATVLGKPDEATQFQSTETTVTNAFNARFLTAAGNYDRNSQTANAMPLALGLVPAAQRGAVLSSLVANVTSAQSRVTAGDVGFLYLLRALSEAGRGDVVFAMLKQASGPGYLYQISHGATALTEAWDARTSSSQNHAMLGHAEEWLYRGLAGINPDPAGPGFKKFVIKPQPQTGLTSVEAQYHSTRGLIRSSWQRQAGGFALTVAVPVNTTATVYVPTANPAAVMESGVAAATAPGVTASSAVAGALMVQVGSGQYAFTAP